MTIGAQVIADSIGSDAPRLMTLQLRYPKFIHGELMTHRAFSRNASSSRAIPVERLIQDVISDPVYPSFFGKNQPGMSAKEEHNTRIELNPGEYFSKDDYSRKEVWDYARESAIDFARAFADAGYHKQIVNRLLEPFCHINVVVTATEWSNFFALRCHPDAQPEMRLLAEAIRTAMEASTPKLLHIGQWHLPYVSDDDYEMCDDLLPGSGRGPAEIVCVEAMVRKLSVARCARVSYLTQEGKQPTIEDDLKLYDRLVGAVPLHASPAEHQATPDNQRIFDGEMGPWSRPHLHGNLRGWVQFRKTLKGENQ